MSPPKINQSAPVTYGPEPPPNHPAAHAFGKGKRKLRTLAPSTGPGTEAELQNKASDDEKEHKNKGFDDNNKWHLWEIETNLRRTFIERPPGRKSNPASTEDKGKGKAPVPSQPTGREKQRSETGVSPAEEEPEMKRSGRVMLALGLTPERMEGAREKQILQAPDDYRGDPGPATLQHRLQQLCWQQQPNRPEGHNPALRAPAPPPLNLSTVPPEDVDPLDPNRPLFIPVDYLDDTKAAPFGNKGSSPQQVETTMTEARIHDQIWRSAYILGRTLTEEEKKIIRETIEDLASTNAPSEASVSPRTPTLAERQPITATNPRETRQFVPTELSQSTIAAEPAGTRPSATVELVQSTPTKQPGETRPLGTTRSTPSTTTTTNLTLAEKRPSITVGVQSTTAREPDEGRPPATSPTTGSAQDSDMNAGSHPPPVQADTPGVQRQLATFQQAINKIRSKLEAFEKKAEKLNSTLEEHALLLETRQGQPSEARESQSTWERQVRGLREEVASLRDELRAVREKSDLSNQKSSSAMAPARHRPPADAESATAAPSAETIENSTISARRCRLEDAAESSGSSVRRRRLVEAESSGSNRGSGRNVGGGSGNNPPQRDKTLAAIDAGLVEQMQRLLLSRNGGTEAGGHSHIPQSQRLVPFGLRTLPRWLRQRRHLVEVYMQRMPTAGRGVRTLRSVLLVIVFFVGVWLAMEAMLYSNRLASGTGMIVNGPFEEKTDVVMVFGSWFQFILFEVVVTIIVLCLFRRETRVGT